MGPINQRASLIYFRMDTAILDKENATTFIVLSVVPSIICIISCFQSQQRDVIFEEILYCKLQTINYHCEVIYGSNAVVWMLPETVNLRFKLHLTLTN